MEQKTFDARQLEQIKTVNAISGVCQKHSAALPKVPKFNEKYELLKAKKEEVSAQSITKHQANASKGGVVTDLSADRTALEILVSDNVPLLVEYCMENSDSAFQSMLPNLSLSKLRKQKPFDLVTNLQSFVLSAKNMDTKKASEFGITESWLELVSIKTKSYNDALPIHASIKQNKPQANVNLGAQIKELMTIKTSMDNLIMGFKNSNPDFFADYNLAKVVNRPNVKAATKKAQLLKNKAKTPKNKKDAPKNSDDAASDLTKASNKTEEPQLLLTPTE